MKYVYVSCAATLGLLCCIALLVLSGCTNGAAMPPSSGGGGGPAVVTIDVNLTLHGPSSSAFGTLAGYAAPTTNVAVGSLIKFVNSDSFAHTATSIPGSSFPAGSPFPSSALSASGSVLSSPWGSGSLAAGTSSATLRVDTAGTYLYGCFYHYGAPMRGIIVAQ